MNRSLHRVALAASATLVAAALHPVAATAGDTDADAVRSTGGRVAPHVGTAGSRWVKGTVTVVAGEGGQPDSYAVETESGKVVPLAGELDVEPLSRFSGRLLAPTAPDAPRKVASYRVAPPRAAAGAATSKRGIAPASTPHTTYVAQITNIGTYSDTDAVHLQRLAAAQAWWVREAEGRITGWPAPTTLKEYASAVTSVAEGCGAGSAEDFRQVIGEAQANVYPGIDFTAATNHLVVLVPDACVQQFAGRGDRLSSFANGGRSVVATADHMAEIAAHEFGHNFGLDHASTHIEYGDMYEVMGAIGDPDIPVLGTGYRHVQGLLEAGEFVDSTHRSLAPQTLQPRSAAAGLRSITFVDPDTGKQHWVDFRNGAGADNGARYESNETAYGGQLYRSGVVIEREDDEDGLVLLRDGAGNVGLQSGSAWANGSGSFRVNVHTAAVEGATASVSTTYREPAAAVTPGAASIAGVARAYETVSASPAGFAPAPAGYRYQWLLNGQPVPGATNRTFALPLTAAGAALSVQVGAYAQGHRPAGVTSPAVPVAPARWYAVEPKVPTIAGTPQVGHTLSATGTAWRDYFGNVPAGMVPQWQWLRDSAPIPGATAATYTLVGADAGRYIQFREVPTAPGFATDTWSRSASTARIAPGSFAVTTKPKIKGKAKVGKVVKAVTGTWSPKAKFSYRWYLNGKKIKKAKKRKLVLTRAMRRKKLTVKVTARSTGYATVSVKSRAKRVR